MPPRRSRVFITVLVAIAIGIWLWNVHEFPTPPAHNQSSIKTAIPDASRSPAAIRQSPPSASAIVMTNARQAASNWLAHAQAGIDARRAKTFGRATAGLMALPPAKAWQALTARSHAGDVSAATAATRLALECKMWKTNPPSEIATARRLDAAGQGLPAHWAEFLRYIGMHEYARENARARDCAQVGGIWDFMRMAIDRFMQPDNPELALVEAEQIEDDGKAIGQLRRLSSQLGSEEARRALGKRLLESRNTNNHEKASNCSNRYPHPIRTLLPISPTVCATVAARLAVTRRRPQPGSHVQPTSATGSRSNGPWLIWKRLHIRSMRSHGHSIDRISLSPAATKSANSPH